LDDFRVIIYIEIFQLIEKKSDHLRRKL
jgi:hypothetical protein